MVNQIDILYYMMSMAIDSLKWRSIDTIVQSSIHVTTHVDDFNLRAQSISKNTRRIKATKHNIINRLMSV